MLTAFIVLHIFVVVIVVVTACFWSLCFLKDMPQKMKGLRDDPKLRPMFEEVAAVVNNRVVVMWMMDMED